MSNVFRRPMFRGGPTNMNGIMSGIQDRKNYADGPEDPNIKSLITKAKELEPAMQEIMGPYEKPSGFEDPLVQLAIQSGLDLMSNAGSQSLIRNIGQTGSRQAPVYFKNLAEQRAAKREYDRGIKSGAIGLAGDILGKEISASGKPGFDEKIYETKVGQYLEQGFEPDVAKNAARFLTQDATELKAKVGNKRYGGVIEFDLSKPDQIKANKQLLKELDGQYVYDPFSGNYKFIRDVDGQLMFDEFNSINEIILTTNKADVEKPNKEIDPTLFGLDIEDPSA
jgi:hypothetical protein